VDLIRSVILFVLAFHRVARRAQPEREDPGFAARAVHSPLYQLFHPHHFPPLKREVCGTGFAIGGLAAAQFGSTVETDTPK